MIRFLLTVLAIWGSMHLYVFLRIWAYTAFPARWAVVLAPLWFALMLSPLAGMMLARRGHPVAGALLVWPGMIWAGAFFLFFCVSILHDAWNGVFSLARWVLPAAGRARLLGPGPILAEAGLVALIVVYGAIEAGWIVTERVQVPTRKLPAGLKRLRIVQVTDVHLGLIVGRRRLARIARLVRAARPDVIVCTGDLVDAEMGNMGDLSLLLADLEAPRGKYAVTGNHEYYAGLEQALAFAREAGFTVLLNEAAEAGEGLTVVGFEDDTAVRFRGGHNWDESEILQSADQDDFVLVLKHRPLVEPDSLPLMDLQLSGHTHRGQIFPFTLAVVWHYPYRHGLARLAPGKYLYTSRGTGTWGLPMRFLNRPEITVIDLVPADGVAPGVR